VGRLDRTRSATAGSIAAMAEQSGRAASVTRFDATVESLAGRRIARLPAEVSAQLPSRGQVAIEGRVDGRDFVAVIEPDGLRGHWVDLERLGANPHAATTEADVTTASRTVTIEFAPAESWPEPEVPADFRSALDQAQTASATWSDITSMARWEWVRWITSTRSPATRDRRIEVGISKLDRGSRRPCCFDLSSCTDPDLSRSGKLLPPS